MGLRLNSPLAHAVFLIFASALLLLAHPQFARAERSAKLLLQAEQLKIYQFESSSAECMNSGGESAGQIKQLLGPGSPGSNLKKDFTKLMGKAFPLIQKNGLLVFFDRLKDHNISSSAFFLRNYPGRSEPAMLLDCSLINNRYLAPALAHELVHYQFRKENIPSWFEEGLAQTLEFQSGGEHPQNSLSLLSENEKLPSLFDLSRPLRNKLSYPLSFLFLRYLTDQFSAVSPQGTGLIAAMLDSDPKLCSGTTWEEMICRGRNFLIKAQAPKEQIHRFTPKGLLRYFALALTLNHQKFHYYSISDWMGFKNFTQEWPTEGLALGPGQFLRFSVKNFPLQFLNSDKEVEVYRVLSNADSYEIIPHNTKLEKDIQKSKSLRGFHQDFILVINTSSVRKINLKAQL